MQPSGIYSLYILLKKYKQDKLQKHCKNIAKIYYLLTFINKILF